MPTDALDTLTRKLEDLRLELDRLDTERTKIKQKISKLQQVAIAVGDRVRISNPTFSVYHNNIESDSLGTVTRVTKKRILYAPTTENLLTASQGTFPRSSHASAPHGSSETVWRRPIRQNRRTRKRTRQRARKRTRRTAEASNT